MFTHISSLTKATLYYIFAFGLAVLVAMMAERLGESSRIISMFTPLVAVLLMMLVVTRDGYTREGWKVLGLHRLGLRSWPLAILAPLVVLSWTYGIVWSTGIGHLDWSRLGEAPNAGDLLRLLVSLIIDYALAEEIGWRGYLLPHLLPLGRTRAMLLSGLLHGIYHLPLMLMTPFYHASGNRFIVIVLFLLTMTLAGVAYGYLRLTSGSVWPPTIAHNAFNTIWEIFATATVAGASPLLLEYLAGESGILTIISLAILVAWLIHRLQRQPEPVPTAIVLAGEPLT
jgi:uncharacterized protein